MKFRRATAHDCALLGALNHELIRDEGHRNTMTTPQLVQRMRDWLASGYTAVIFKTEKAVTAYALYREERDEIYLRHLFVVREYRRAGIGRKAFEILRTKMWPADRRLTVEVLAKNTGAVKFWRAVGYEDYSLKLEILPAKKVKRA